MKLHIVHSTEYRFEREVFFEPHILRLHPGISPHQQVLSHSLDIYPPPAGSSLQKDAENNIIQFCWFDGQHDSLRIVSNTILNSRKFNPFNFLLHPIAFAHLPFQYDPAQEALLSPSLAVIPLRSDISGYIDSLRIDWAVDTIGLLRHLTHSINSDFKTVYRKQGMPLPPDEVFKNKEGSCRDLSWMAVQMLRHLGIAARFVSGYLILDGLQSEFELHAWVEAFFPGAGWIGIDPSQGIFTTDAHVMVAASAAPANTMPVTGTIRGDSASTLVTSLSIKRLDEKE